MTDKLVEFVNKLDLDPALDNAYFKNPQKILEDNGVEPEDIALMLDNDNIKALQKRFEMTGIKSIIRVSHFK